MSLSYLNGPGMYICVLVAINVMDSELGRRALGAHKITKDIVERAENTRLEPTSSNAPLFLPLYASEASTRKQGDILLLTSHRQGVAKSMPSHGSVGIGISFQPQLWCFRGTGNFFFSKWRE